MSRSLAAGVIFLSSVFSAYAPVTAAEVPAPAPQSTTNYNFPVCHDHTGTAAAYLPNDIGLDRPWVVHFGVRYLDQENIQDPVVFYDPDEIQNLSKAALDFTFAHECFHLSSGDAYRAYEIINSGERLSRRDMHDEEDAADCHAARRMRHEFSYSVEDLRSALEEINSFTRMGNRTAHIIDCYNSPVIS